MADILLSYERTDRQRVAPIVALLEAHGWSVQWEPADEAGEAPPAAGCIIAAWSFDSVDSPPVLAAARHGLARGALISLSIDFSQPPREMEAAASLALAGWTGDESSPKAQELLAAVGKLLSEPPAQPHAEPPMHSRAADGGARTTAAVQAQPAPPPGPEAAKAPEGQKLDALSAVLEAEPEPEPEPEPEFHDEQATEPTERVPQLVRREGDARPVWAFPDDPEAEDGASPSRLPPALLRDRVPRPLPADDIPPPAPARRGAALALAAGLAIVAAAAAAGVVWMMDLPGGGSNSGSEVAAVEVGPDTTPRPTPKPVATPTAPAGRPQEVKPPDIKPPASEQQGVKQQQAKLKDVQPTPAALPPETGLEIEDILGQVTPRVEELLADATRRISIGDIRGARKVLAAPETAHSGSLTFLLAETYDPNKLPSTLRASLADPARARALYRKARELGDGRAQGRLDALKASGWAPAGFRVPLRAGPVAG